MKGQDICTNSWNPNERSRHLYKIAPNLACAVKKSRTTDLVTQHQTCALAKRTWGPCHLSWACRSSEWHLTWSRSTMKLHLVTNSPSSTWSP